MTNTEPTAPTADRAYESKVLGLEATAQFHLSVNTTSRRKREKSAARTRLDATRMEIEQLAAARVVPFATRDNGVHLYHEADGYLVLRNHGSAWWVGLQKVGNGRLSGFKVVATDLDAQRALETTASAPRPEAA